MRIRPSSCRPYSPTLHRAKPVAEPTQKHPNTKHRDISAIKDLKAARFRASAANVEARSAGRFKAPGWLQSRRSSKATLPGGGAKTSATPSVSRFKATATAAQAANKLKANVAAST